jgi:hypothetical protein
MKGRKNGVILNKTNEQMIAIIQVKRRKSVLEATSVDEAIIEAKRILNSPKSKMKECTIIMCKEYELYTIKKPNKNEKL